MATLLLPKRFRDLPELFKARTGNVPGGARGMPGMFLECPEDAPVMLQRGFYF